MRIILRAAINAVNSGTKWTALHCAAFQGHGPVILRLMMNSPDVTLLDDKSRYSYNSTKFNITLIKCYKFLSSEQLPILPLPWILSGHFLQVWSLPYCIITNINMIFLLSDAGCQRTSKQKLMELEIVQRVCCFLLILNSDFPMEYNYPKPLFLILISGHPFCRIFQWWHSSNS